MPYIENSLDDKTCEQVSLHIAECAKCSAEVSILRNISGSLKKAAPCIEVAPDLWANVNAGITKESAPKTTFSKLWFPRIAIAGSLGALIIAVIFAFNTTSQIEHQNIAKNETQNPKINSILPHDDNIKKKKVESIAEPKTKSGKTGKKQSPASKPAPVMMAKLPPAQSVNENNRLELTTKTAPSPIVAESATTASGFKNVSPGKANLAEEIKIGAPPLESENSGGAFWFRRKWLCIRQ